MPVRRTTSTGRMGPRPLDGRCVPRPHNPSRSRRRAGAPREADARPAVGVAYRWRMTWTIVRSAAAGVGLGAFTAVADRLPIDTPLIVLVALANAVGPWVVVAFLAGSGGRTAWVGAALGTGALILAVVTYYVVASVVLDGRYLDPSRAAAVWTAVAVMVGGAVGAAGAAWANGAGRWQIAGVSLLAGALLAEAISRFVEVEGWTGYDLARTALQVTAMDGAVAALAVWLLPGRGRLAAGAGAVAIGTAGASLLLVVIPFIRGAAAG